MNQMQIGNYIAKKRKEKNMTQARLAEVLGVSNKTISKWETGKCMPDYSIMGQLCTELDITLPELMDGTDITDSTNKTYDSEQILELLQRIEVMMNQNKTGNHSGIPWQKILAVAVMLTAVILLYLYVTLGGRQIGGFIGACLLTIGITLFLRERDLDLRIGCLVLFFIDFYLRFRHKGNWTLIFATPYWNASMNYISLAQAWFQFTLIAAIVMIGVEYWKRNTNELPRWKHGLIPEIAAVVGISVLLFGAEQQDIRIAAMKALGSDRYLFAYNILDWLRIVAFTNGMGRWLTRKERGYL